MSRNSIRFAAVCFVAIWTTAGTLAALSGCQVGNPPAVRLIKQSTQKCQEAADLLAGVKDVASAKAAAPRLEKLIGEIDRINEQIERIHDPSDVDPADESAINAELPEAIVQMQRLVSETARIRKEPAVAEALGDAWKRLAGVDVLGADAPGIEAGS